MENSLLADWRMLCALIGERRAGTDAERRAAEYIHASFARADVPSVVTEAFPCRSLRSAEVEVYAGKDARAPRVAAATLVGAPGTPRGRSVSGPLVWLELPENAARIKPRAYRGKVVAIFGPLPTSLALHRRLVAAEPLAVVHVDDRLPFPWVKNDGVYPYWARQHGMPPTVAVPYLDGWRWRRDGLANLTVRVDPQLIDAESQNVIAELPGRDPSLRALVLTAHHDTQCHNVGADDNASGVVCLLALARAFAGRRFRRTVRLISFGAEEQLSVGSAAYVQRHRALSAKAGLAINFDSVASPLGHWQMYVSGTDALARRATQVLARHGLDVDARLEVTPFSDHFPFNRVGVPSLWFMRTNFPGGRWQHHSGHDSLENISPAPVNALLAAVTPFVTALANSERWPFPSTVPAAQRQRVQQLGRELYG